MDAQMVWFLHPLTILLLFSRRPSIDQFVFGLLAVQGETENSIIDVD